MSIRHISGHEFSLLAPTLVDIHIAAMGYPPFIRSSRIDVWRREILQPGFRAVIAVETHNGEERIVGVAYGLTGIRNRWWDSQLIQGLKAKGGPTKDELAILDNYFEVAEVHVSTDAQNRGVGTAMLHALLAQVEEKWALLSTPEVDNEANAAFGLYRKMGFVDILRFFHYAGDPRPFAILGRRLPVDAPR